MMFFTILLIDCLEAKTDRATGNKKCFQDRNNEFNSTSYRLNGE